MESSNSQLALAQFRRDARTTEVTPTYRGWRHFLLTNALALGGVMVLLGQLQAMQSWEWWTIPLTFLYANLAEYLGHRFVMHRPRPGLKLVFKRHVGLHHRFFTDAKMEVEQQQDWKFVLFPPILIFLFIGVFGTPVALLLGFLLSWNTAVLFAITGLLYFLNYEYLHLAYHLGESHWVSHLPGMKTLRRLHTVHHDQTIMTECNFNITYPIGDWLFRTMR